MQCTFELYIEYLGASTSSRVIRQQAAEPTAASGQVGQAINETAMRQCYWLVFWKDRLSRYVKDTKMAPPIKVEQKNPSLKLT